MHGGINNLALNIDIDTDFSVNLNPYGLSDPDRKTVDDAIAEGVANAGAYPDLLQRDARAAIAVCEGVDADCVIAGNGASELITALFNMLSPRKALLFEPAFSGYARVLSAIRRCSIERFYLSEENGFLITEDAVSAIGEDTDVVILSDPNNPTGKNIRGEILARILEKTDDTGIAVVLDESFYMLSDKSTGHIRDMRELLERFQNLFILRSYTKSFALPGIRMGYVLSSPENIRYLAGFLPEWNLSCLSSSVMKACAKITGENDFLPASVEFIRNERRFLVEGLEGLGLKVYDSDTVFVLFRCESGADLYTALLDKKILIRDCADFPGLGKGFYRAAVRCREDNGRLIKAIGELLR